MERKQNIVPLKELNLSSRFLFDEVMEDTQTHQDVLEIIFGKEIPLLDEAQTEKELRVSPLIRSVRIDIFAMDREQNVYDTEMQGERKNDLAKRSRYYQSLIDTSLLEPGVPNYNLLNRSFIIMILTFDLFGYGKYMYTFEPRCKEVSECVLADGATRIFLNTKGKNDNEVSEELVEFLHYIENSTDEVAKQVRSERVRRIHDRVCKVRMNEEVGVKYMQAWEEKYYEREEGREEGELLKLIKMVRKKMGKGLKVSEIADMLEEDENDIQVIYNALDQHASEHDPKIILDIMKRG